MRRSFCIVWNRI